MTAEYVSMYCTWADKPTAAADWHARCDDRACTCYCHDEFYDAAIWDATEWDES
jgi:hypothetical protein